MHKHRRSGNRASAAILVGALLPAVVVFAGAASGAQAAEISAVAAPASVRAEDVSLPAPAPVPEPTGAPTTPPDPDPSPTPEPTEEPVPTTEPEEPAPVPTVDPVPTEEPVQTAEPVPVPVPAEPEEPAPDESESGSDSDDEYVPVIETPTPVPTETAIAPVPVVTDTAPPAPAINIPFYPPASASTARDVFPFVIAGIIAALLLLGGVAAYVFTRWRVRRIRYPKARPGESLLPKAAFGSHLLSGSHSSSHGELAPGMRLPWGDRVSSQHAQEISYALGFTTLVRAAGGAVQTMPWGADPRPSSGGPAPDRFALAFAQTAAEGLQAPPKRNLLSVLFHRDPSARSATEPASLQVFTDTREQAPDRSVAAPGVTGDTPSTATTQHRLGFAPRAKSAGASARFDLGFRPL